MQTRFLDVQLLVSRTKWITFSALVCCLFSGHLTAQEFTGNKLIATQISADNAEQLVKNGPDSIGGIGDWHLSNGTVCAVISNVEHEHEFSAKGGVLVDLGFCGRNDDHYTFNQDLLNGSRNTPINSKNVTAELSETSASLFVLGQAAGVESLTEYSLSLSEPTQLHISKQLTIIDEALADFNLLSLGSFNYHSLETFILNTAEPKKSLGFNNIDFVTRGNSAIHEAANDADTIITLSPPEAEAPITYGWRLLSAVRQDGNETTQLPRYVLADEEALAFMVLVDSFWLGDGANIGFLQLPQIPLLSVETGTKLEFEEVIYLGKNASVNTVTDQIFRTHPLVTGTTLYPGSALHIKQSNGAPLTHLAIPADGKFSFRAPVGQYNLEHLASADRNSLSTFEVQQKTNNVLSLTSSPAMNNIAQLALPAGQAMRLVFVGINGTPSPSFKDRLTVYSVYDGTVKVSAQPVSQIFLAGAHGDLKNVDIAPGEYLVYATRGPEFSVEKSEIKINVGESFVLDIPAPKRVLTTPNFIAADLHVHAGDSFDNTFSNKERVRTFVAEHGEIMVNSEHDTLVDFSPIIESMKVADKVSTITGMEMTSSLLSKEKPYTGGHVNFFPFNPQPLQYRNGMPQHENQRLRSVLYNVRQQNAKTLVQLNHPRRNLSLSGSVPDDYPSLIDNGAFLDHMGVGAYPYNPNATLTSGANKTLISPDPVTGVRDLDIDAIELVNPGGIYHDERIAAVRLDWMSFILQGEKITGTANSDSHHARQQVAMPRNMIAVTNDTVLEYNLDEFLSSLKEGNVYGTTGPMLDLNLDGALMGDTLSADKAVLELKVSSADWVPLATADIQVNGQKIKTLDLSTKRHWQVPLTFKHDSIVTIEVFGPASPIYKAIYPELTPYAFSNPIWVDANQDGVWESPGWPLTTQP